jgi:hypothetical protein
VRYFDWTDKLEVLQIENGKIKRVIETSDRILYNPSRSCRIKAAVAGDFVFAKAWPEGGQEPDWQLTARCDSQGAGEVGVLTTSGSPMGFEQIEIRTGSAIQAVMEEAQRKQQQYEAALRKDLKLTIEPTPFVLKSDDGPRRKVLIRATSNGEAIKVQGDFSVSFGDFQDSVHVASADLERGAYTLLLPEPSEPCELKITFDSEIGKQVQASQIIPPVREWMFYMTEHTHYDIGFTAPQPEVIDQLSRDMEHIVPLVRQTADWPEPARFKWTVEVSGLMKNFMERHSQKEIDELVECVRDGSVEICAYYLNMATELVGHEELIRCLYYAQELRDRFDFDIDTAMIDDVPGYTWALADVFASAGVPRVSFRANSIRGNFLWYRDGAVPRPFYWEGPAGQRIFVWYTDSYREGNFWRRRGLQEERFLAVIQRNLQAGGTSNLIQLRMGGDNLPPEINACYNAREWYEKYHWPKVRVATNREFLEDLEKAFGQDAPTVRGDIPSWWAEGPGSTARETGINRLVHDQIVGIEGLWTRLKLGDSRLRYPQSAIGVVYDNMFHFDEHTWGSRLAIRDPRHATTIEQWAHKADFAHTARRLADDLEHHALAKLTAKLAVPQTNGHTLAVWNLLSWPRTDLVEVDLAARGIDPEKGIRVRDADDRIVPGQVSIDRQALWFVARDVPALSAKVYTIELAEQPGAFARETTATSLENDTYRLTFDTQTGLWTNWYDKRRSCELLDADARYRGNQPLRELPVGGREAMREKRPLELKHQAAETSEFVTAVRGPVFDELVYRTSLPGCPRILQRYRLLHELDCVDVANELTKEELFEPEAIYFAFPFKVSNPRHRLEIANASMWAGQEQLPLSCQDFYAIQHWAAVAGDDVTVAMAPVDAPLLAISDLNAYRWADQLSFDRGHLYSMALNNYWFTNFRAGQYGTLSFRYRLAAMPADQRPAEIARFATQPFLPLKPVWISTKQTETGERLGDLVTVSSPSAMVTCVKLAEKGDGVIVRVLEMDGAETSCRVTLDLADDRALKSASLTDVVERFVEQLDTDGHSVKVNLAPNSITTIKLVPEEF